MPEEKKTKKERLRSAMERISILMCDRVTYAVSAQDRSATSYDAIYKLLEYELRFLNKEDNHD